MSDQISRDSLPLEGKAYYDKLDAIDAYIARSNFARVEKFQRPLSEQYKAELRHRVPENNIDYEKVDKLQRKIGNGYLNLRIWTFFLLFLYFIIMIIACAGFESTIRNWLSEQLNLPMVNNWRAAICTAAVYFTLSAAIAGIFWVTRKAIRSLFFRNFSEDVGDLAHKMSSKFDEISKETNYACGQLDTRHDPGFGHGWPDRAWAWSRIALWSSIKGDALDRYSTVVLWKMKVFDTDVERASRFTKGIVMIVSVFCLFLIPKMEFVAEPPFFYVFAIAAGLFIAIFTWMVTFYFTFMRNEVRENTKFHLQALFVLIYYFVLCSFLLWVTGNILSPWQSLTQLCVGFTFIVAFWWGWIVSGEKSDDLWTEIFCKKIGKDTINTSFYFDSFSGRIRNLVEIINDKERNSRGTPSPPKE